MPRVYIGIGSNLGPRAENVKRGLRRLNDKGFRIVSISAIYETEPVNMPGGGRFLNLAVAAETRESPRRCKLQLQAIERELGRRKRHARNAPRPIDLDLLFYGRRVILEAGLVVPHPRLHERAFVLVPLADIAPNLIHPVRHRRIATLLKTVNRKGVRAWTRS
jgi:2-amino-4-hydroxy-6-hydroxymethyldihydropteridine diphosphokinase